jgi:hypothetical protein
VADEKAVKEPGLRVVVILSLIVVVEFIAL